MRRCDWVKNGDELYIRYHDTEWGEKVWETFARPCQILLEETKRNIDRVYSVCKTDQLIGTLCI